MVVRHRSRAADAAIEEASQALRRAQSRRAQVKGSVTPGQHRAAHPVAGTQSPGPSTKGAARRAAYAQNTDSIKAAEGALNSGRQARRLALKPVVSRAATHRAIVGTTVLGAGATWAGLRRKADVAKYSRGDADAFAVGTLGGGLAYQEASYALKGRDRRNEAKIKADPHLRGINEAHQTKSGVVPGKTPAGDAKWLKHFRTYPKELPGSTLKRTLSYTHGGSTGVALTGLAGLGAGLGAVKARRSVSKAYGDAPNLLARHAQTAYKTARHNRNHMRWAQEESRDKSLSGAWREASHIERNLRDFAHKDNKALGQALTASRKKLKGAVAKGYLPVLPWDGPRVAKHASRGMVGIHEYHGDDTFTILHKGEKVLARRHQLTFTTPVKKVGPDNMTNLDHPLSAPAKNRVIDPLNRRRRQFKGKKAFFNDPVRNEASEMFWDSPHLTHSSVRIKSREYVRQADKARRPGLLLGSDAVVRHKPVQTAVMRVRRVVKADSKYTPLKTSINDDDAKRLVERHGLKGPLPKELTREQKMAAYEARYVSSGGRKAEKWQHRAVRADKAKNAGLAGATIGSALWTAGRVARGGKTPAARAVVRHLSHPRLNRAAETAIGASATIGGAGELYASHARRKRSSYASAPGGVAASALRRMQGYTPNS